MSGLDLHERLRQESRALPAPSFTFDGVQRAGRRRRRRRLAGTGAALVAVVALAGVVFTGLPDGEAPPAAEEPPFVWDLAVLPAFEADPEAVRDAVAATPLVAEARLTEYDRVRLGSEVGAPALAEPDTAVSAPVIVVVLASGTDVSVAERELALVGGVEQVWPSPEVAHGRLERLFDSIRAESTVHGDEVEILQPPPGPDPAFDPTGLGDPAPLLPVEEAGAPSLDDLALLRNPLESTRGRDPRYPVVHVGALESGHRLVMYGNGEGNVCESSFIVGHGRGGGCDRMFAELENGFGGSSTVTGGGFVGTIWVRVPSDTAVVVATTAEKTMWQRPVARYAYFAVPAPGPVEFVALAADGAELGRWSAEV